MEAREKHQDYMLLSSTSDFPLFLLHLCLCLCLLYFYGWPASPHARWIFLDVRGWWASPGLKNLKLLINSSWVQERKDKKEEERRKKKFCASVPVSLVIRTFWKEGFHFFKVSLCSLLHFTQAAYIYSDLSLNLVKAKDMLVWLIFLHALLLSPFKV